MKIINTESQPVVSIVIVCMNKMSNLDICLPSIEKYTKTPHVVYVVAYLFSEDNLIKLHKQYPWVKVIESNEIRGFSENNNLALRKVTTPLTFILNDDTEFKEPVLDKLIISLHSTPDATVMSPVLWNGYGDLLYSGRRKETFWDYLLCALFKYKKPTSVYEKQEGIFMTYTLSGAAFLIYTEEFKKIGYFNELYFFCPEDVEVGWLLNAKGKHCYVDSEANIIHYEAVSSKKSNLFYATTICAHLGSCYFYGKCILFRWILLILFIYRYCYHKLINLIKPSNHHKDYIYIYKKVVKFYFKKILPKKAFICEYKKLSTLDKSPLI